MSKITQVNVYQRDGLWCYAALTDAGHDHSDTLDIDSDASEVEVSEAVTGMFPDARVRRVDDV